MGNDFITNKDNTNYTETAIETYNYLKNFYQYSARISLIWEMIKKSFNIEEYESIDYNVIQNGPLMSWLIDRQIDWQNGKDVNFSEIFRALETAGDFTSTEKLMFSEGKIEERLWAIFLLITRPELEFN